MRKPLQVLSKVNLFIPLSLFLFLVSPLSHYQLNIESTINLLPLFLYAIAGLLLSKPSNVTVYIFLIIHLVNTIFLLFQTPLNTSINQLMTLSINIFNSLAIFFYFWPFIKTALFHLFPQLNGLEKLKPKPNICTYRLPSTSQVYDATLLSLRDKQTIFTSYTELEINQIVNLQIAFNGLIFNCPGEVINKFEYKGKAAITLNMKFQTLMDYIIYQTINRKISSININTIETRNDEREKARMAS
ncbi:MAG: hypothetical protein OEY33_02010 [Bdellovibrionales bacterium]|nr:hypothetical protein [Bdellovibrionales bacterium]